MRHPDALVNRELSHARSSRADGTPHIDDLARSVDTLIESRWMPVLRRHGRRLELLFQAAPIRACEAYLGLLMRPLQTRLEQLELLSYPRWPGTLAAAREWHALEESHHERWFGVTICTEADEPVGTLITVLHCGAWRFELTRRPAVIGITSVRFDDARKLGRAMLNSGHATGRHHGHPIGHDHG
jgi:hypothetical protein